MVLANGKNENALEGLASGKEQGTLFLANETSLLSAIIKGSK